MGNTYTDVLKDGARADALLHQCAPTRETRPPRSDAFTGAGDSSRSPGCGSELGTIQRNTVARKGVPGLLSRILTQAAVTCTAGFLWFVTHSSQVS